MKKSTRFKPIQQLTESRKQDAAKALGMSNQRVSEQEQRLRELQQYRIEYQRHYQQRGQAGISVAKLLELQRFLLNLDRAIAQQQRAVEMVQQEREHKRSLWQQAHGKNLAMDKVVERYRSDEDYLASRREQKENDEMAQRKRDK
ncbi:MAG: flagellar export protein FliJ [Thiohalomonadaceae bacterium]